MKTKRFRTKRVAIGFGRNGMIRRPLMTQEQHWAKTAQTDHVTLRSWPLILEVMAPVADAGRRLPSVYQAWSSYALPFGRYWRTMCVSINGPGDLDLSFFDLETGMWIASKVGNFPSKFGYARPLGSRIIRYVRDERTDGPTDRQKQRLLPLPYTEWA